jgi:hypothetical protein
MQGFVDLVQVAQRCDHRFDASRGANIKTFMKRVVANLLIDLKREELAAKRGGGRPDRSLDATMLPFFVALGITSVDSAAPLRQAWLAAKDNYYTRDSTFAAIRIPAVREDRGAEQTLVGKSTASFAELSEAERAALSAVRSYARREATMTHTLNAVRAYDELLGSRVDAKNTERRHALYRETLKARPWDHCKCPICSEIGVEAVIFRGNNRNRRRGFHNLWVLRRRIERALESPSELPVKQGRMALA